MWCGVFLPIGADVELAEIAMWWTWKDAPMTPEFAESLLHGVFRAWDGACLCRRRVLKDPTESAPNDADLAPRQYIDSVGHDIDYYAWEAVRIIKIADKAASAGLGTRSGLEAAITNLRSAAPHLQDFRDAVTHIEDNRSADDAVYALSAIRLLPGRVEYLVDPRYQVHDRLRELVESVEEALQPLVLVDIPELRWRFRWSLPVDAPPEP